MSVHCSALLTISTFSLSSNTALVPSSRQPSVPPLIAGSTVTAASWTSPNGTELSNLLGGGIWSLSGNWNRSVSQSGQLSRLSARSKMMSGVLEISFDAGFDPNGSQPRAAAFSCGEGWSPSGQRNHVVMHLAAVIPSAHILLWAFLMSTFFHQNPLVWVVESHAVN